MTSSLSTSHLQAQNVVFALDCDPALMFEHDSDKIAEQVEAEELVELIIELRNRILMQGCQIPDLTAFLDGCRLSLSNQGFFINDELFDALKREIRALDRGDCFDQIKHRHKKKKSKELRVNSKTAVGFLKFVAGGLLCLVPVPVVQGFGVGLAVLGVSEMADGAREQADASSVFDENQRTQRELEFQH